MSQPKENTVVDDHRNMLQVSKNISDFQEQNLKSWGFIFFNDVDSVSVKWNFFRKNKTKDFFAGKVDFDVKFTKGVNPSLTPELTQIGIDRLIASTKFLFWSETVVKIKLNGKSWKISELQEEAETSAQKK